MAQPELPVQYRGRCVRGVLYITVLVPEFDSCVRGVLVLYITVLYSTVVVQTGPQGLGTSSL
jgi:hypothetical protein